MKDARTSNSFGVRSKPRDIPIPAKRYGLISNHFIQEGRLMLQQPAHWIVFPQRKRSGSLFVVLMTLMRRSEKNWQPFVRPAKWLRSSISWCKHFYTWFASSKENTWRVG